MPSNEILRVSLQRKKLLITLNSGHGSGRYYWKTVAMVQGIFGIIFSECKMVRIIDRKSAR